MDSININLSEFGGVIVALLTVGAILKNAFPAFPTRFIPALTWLLGVVAYLTLTSGWTDPKQWLAAIMAAATATGVHSGLKNTVKSDGPPDQFSMIFLLGSLALLTGCGTPFQNTVTLTAAVDSASKEYASAYNAGLVSEHLDREVEAAHLVYRKSARVAAEALRAYKLTENEADYAEAFLQAQRAAMAFVDLIVPFVTQTKAISLKASVEKARRP